MTYRRAVAAAVLAALAACPAATAGSLSPSSPPASPRPLHVQAAASSSYPAYLGGARHTSYAGTATTVTTTNAASLRTAWSWTPTIKNGSTGKLSASPTVQAGVIYVGAGTGDFYALDAATGRQRWRKTLPISSCNGSGIVSTATVARDPGTNQLTVYVGGADHYLYALSAATGATIWRTIVGGTDSHYFNFSSPAVANGHVYMGVSTACEVPLGGGVQAFDQRTGATTGRYFVATPTAGASIYSSVAVDGSGSVYATSGDSNGSPPGDSTSMIKLRGGDLARLAAWKIPGQEPLNLDFQASPTLFMGGATAMVGACNKNGNFYAFRTADISAGPVWTRRLGISAPEGKLAFCGGAAVYDAAADSLYVGANRKTATAAAGGGLYALVPATGAVKWYTPLPAGPVVGSPSLDGAGVLAVPTYDTTSKTTNAVYLIRASDGAVLTAIPYTQPMFPQPVFAAGKLLVAGPTLKAYQP